MIEFLTGLAFFFLALFVVFLGAVLAGLLLASMASIASRYTLLQCGLLLLALMVPTTAAMELPMVGPVLLGMTFFHLAFLILFRITAIHPEFRPGGSYRFDLRQLFSLLTVAAIGLALARSVDMQQSEELVAAVGLGYISATVSMYCFSRESHLRTCVVLNLLGFVAAIGIDAAHGQSYRSLCYLLLAGFVGPCGAIGWCLVPGTRMKMDATENL